MKIVSKAFVLSVMCLCACTREFEPAVTAPQQNEEAAISENIIPGRVYVEFSDEMAEKIESGAVDFIIPGIGMESYRKLFREDPADDRFSKRHHEAGLDRWYAVDFDKAVPSTKAATELNDIEGVVAVSYPRRMKRFSNGIPFNDPGKGRQWNLLSDGYLNRELNTTDFKEGCDINVIPVWEEFTAGSGDVIVAVIDDGVNAEHEDLSDIVIPFGPGGSKDFVTDSFDSHPADHGSHVASIIAAVNNNRKGFCGVAGGSDGTGGVRIMSCDICDDDEWADDEGTLAAFVWAADNGAVICNNSWGYVFESEEEAKKYAYAYTHEDSPIKTAIDYFANYAGFDAEGNQTGPVAGGTVIFASGNDGYAYGVPACIDRVIAVGACGPSYNFTSYSNYGEWVDIVAPGGDYGGRYSYNGIYRYVLGASIENEMYIGMAGTSQAAPHVAGVAALLASYFGGPGFTSDMLQERLIEGSRKGVLSGRMSGPLLDAYGAFTCTLGGPVTISTKYTGDYTVKSHEEFSISYSIGGNVTKHLPVEVETDCPALEWESTTSSASITVNALETDPGQYNVTIFVGKGTGEEVSESFVLTILENHAPTVAEEIDDMVISTSGASVSIASVFTDQDGEMLTCTASSSNESIVGAEMNNGVLSVVPITYGMAEVTVTARDARGAGASQTFRVLVRNTSKPYDVYPNPVTDYLYVRPGRNSVSLDIEVVGDFGRKVITRTATGTPFEPVKLDMTTLAPGQYMLMVKESSGNEFTQNIVKL